MKQYKRNVQVAIAIKKELAKVIQAGFIKDDRFAPFVSIVEVDLSPDLRNAKVIYSILETENPSYETGTQAALESHSKQISGLIGRKLNLKYAPRMVFENNKSLKGAFDLINLIDSVNEEATSSQEDLESNSNERD